MILYYVLKSTCHCCIHQWQAESPSVLYTEISVPLLYTLVASRELFHIMYRNTHAIAVYINGKQGAPLYYILKSRAINNPRVHTKARFT